MANNLFGEIVNRVQQIPQLLQSFGKQVEAKQTANRVEKQLQARSLPPQNKPNIESTGNIFKDVAQNLNIAKPQPFPVYTPKQTPQTPIQESISKMTPEQKFSATGQYVKSVFQGVAQGVTKFALSAYSAPKDIYTGNPSEPLKLSPALASVLGTDQLSTYQKDVSSDIASGTSPYQAVLKGMGNAVFDAWIALDAGRGAIDLTRMGARQLPDSLLYKVTQTPLAVDDIMNAFRGTGSPSQQAKDFVARLSSEEKKALAGVARSAEQAGITTIPKVTKTPTELGKFAQVPETTTAFAEARPTAQLPGYTPTTPSPFPKMGLSAEEVTPVGRGEYKMIAQDAKRFKTFNEWVGRLRKSMVAPTEEGGKSMSLLESLKGQGLDMEALKAIYEGRTPTIKKPEPVVKDYSKDPNVIRLKKLALERAAAKTPVEVPKPKEVVAPKIVPKIEETTAYHITTPEIADKISKEGFTVTKTGGASEHPLDVGSKFFDTKETSDRFIKRFGGSQGKYKIKGKVFDLESMGKSSSERIINSLKKFENFNPKTDTYKKGLLGEGEANSNAERKLFRDLKDRGYVGIREIGGEITIWEPNKIVVPEREPVKLPTQEEVQKPPELPKQAPAASTATPEEEIMTAKQLDDYFNTQEGEETVKRFANHIRESERMVGGKELQTTEKELVDTFIKALKSAKPVRTQQEYLYRKERAKRIGAAEAIAKKTTGREGLYAELSKFAGQLPKVEFESILQVLSKENIDSLFEMVKRSPNLRYIDTIPARQALAKILEGGVPTKGELKLLSRVFPDELIKTLLDRQPFFKKLKETALQVISIPRAIMASFDVSASLRQGALLMPSNARAWGSAFIKQFKAMGSERAYKAVNDNIQSSPYYNLAVESGVEFTDVGSLMTGREEKFMSSLAEKLPLGIGFAIRRSNMAYTAFMNNLRMSAFETWAEDAVAAGIDVENNPKVADNIARWINNFTGRGEIPKSLEPAAELLNAMFFSPRYAFSRLRILNPIDYVKADAFTRKAALKALFAYAGMFLTILTLARLAGAQVETDPRSSDFGKIKIGNTRLDLGAGLLQYLVLASRLVMGQTKSGSKVTELGPKIGQTSRLDLIGRFFSYKESPIFSFITQWLGGVDASGKPFSVTNELASRFVPLALQDIYDLYKDNPKLLPLAGLGILGVGLQTYLPTNKKSSGRIQGSPFKKSRGTLKKFTRPKFTR